ncbi:MAG TPA: tyrosine-type recombinase/integrase [Chloroflexota bacterium]|nr:tyrosine-type recombinase/integrase [Chloroflexota bacterium]
MPMAVAAFGETLLAKSRRTAANYQSALRRFAEFLEDDGLPPADLTTNQLAHDVLERFYTWLLKHYGREKRSTCVAYVTEVRAFFRFLDRRRWLHPDVSYERMKDGLRELVGRQPYKTPRVGDGVARVVTYVNQEALAPGSGEQERLTLLRDRALLRTLYATGLRREELSRLNRTDIQDGRAAEGLVTGKGNKDRIVFFDDTALEAIRAYLAARGDTFLPLFLRHDDGRGRPGTRGERWRLSPQSVWGTVKKYAALAGVDATTHHLRHLKARVLLNQGAQLAEVQDILGHASPETTKKIYAHYKTTRLREAFDRFSLPPEAVAGQSPPTPD